jgi:glycosyltransferase involved in cell wall biosynthesis
VRLLIIDPNMNLSSPSMKGVVSSLAAWKERGIETEVWCWTCDEHLPATIRKLPRIGDVRYLGGFVFSWLVFWRAWWLFKVRKQLRPDVIYSIAWYHKACDVCHVHFSQFDWEKRQRLLGTHSLRDLAEHVINRLNLHRARSFLRRTTARKLVCVSQSVADDMRAENSRIPIQVLPNSYDPQRFHLGVRDQFRAATRSKLGYDESRRVFIFVSTGHYRRKGFFLAVEAVRCLRQSHPEACLLVVGGREERLASLRRTLGADHDWITFTGMVPDVETYFAAADALLFPSYSEAFALVEVEAAACGLPLFLTPHHGSEMILDDGVNGRLLGFDAAQIAQVLAEFVEGRWKPTGTSLKHAVDSATYAQRLGDLLLEAHHTA